MREKIPASILGAIKIAGLYLLIGFLWILFSDQLADLFAANKDVFHQVSIYKGWGYVLVTGILLYFLIKNHTNRISANETWLRMAYDAADMGTWQNDIVAGTVRFDERACKHFGFDTLEVPLADVSSRVHPDDATRLMREIASTSDPATDGRYATEYRVIHRNESVHWLRVEAHVSFEGVGEKRRPVLVVGTSRDITEAKRSDLQTRYFARLYAALSQVNQTIVRCTEQMELFTSICQVAVEYGEFRLAWVGLLDEETGTLSAAAEHGFGENKFPFQKMDVHKKPFRDDVAGIALRSGRVEICNDIHVEPHMTHWRELAIRDGYHSVAAVPIRQNARVIGLLMLFAADIDFFMVIEEQKLLEEMGVDISFALDNMQLEKQREQAVKEVIESEERFQKAFYSGPVGLAITRGSDGVYIDANRAFSEIVGFSQEELIGQTSLGLNITTPAQRQEYTSMMAEDGFVLNKEMTLRNRSGERRVVLGSMEIIELNNETCVLSTAIDITERKQVEEALNKSELRWTSLVKTIPDFIALFDKDGKYLFLNHYAEGYSEKDVIGRQNTDFISDDFKEEYLQTFEKAKQTGQIQYLEYQAKGDWGSVRYYDSYFTPVLEDGQLVTTLVLARDITDRKAAEQVLFFSQQQLRSMIHEAPISIAMFDKEMKFIAASHRWVREYGNGQTDLTGKYHYEVSPDIPERWKEAHQRGQAGETIVNEDDLWERGDGSKNWLSWAIVPWHDMQGNIGGIIISAEDITARRLGESNLRESEERFRQLADNIEEVFWIFDPIAKKEVYISPAFEKIWMRPVIELIANADLFFEFILPEDRPRVRAVTSRQMLGEKTEVQYRITRPDGSIRWIWDRGFPVFDEDGNITRIVAIVSDVSEQKQAEINLLELNRTLEQRVAERTAEVMDLYENAPAGYHSIDANGLIVRMNQTELNWLGYTREEIVGVKCMTDLYTPESKKIFSETFPHHKEFGFVKDLELEIIRKDGTIIPVLLNGTAIYNEQGEFVMSRSTFFDITERKQAELKLQAANTALEKAAKLKDEFLANMSHELRTPLNAIIGLSESLQIGTYGQLVPRQENILRVIRESGQHLLELINDILDLSKIEAGMLELKYETIDLKSICDASMLMVSEPAQKKGLQISIFITDEIQTIQADKRRLKQMIVNLMSNAVKFTPQFGSMRLEVQPENDHAVRFTVSDTGIGISADQLENLFKPFVQVDSSLARKYEGTGLGLALVRQLAEMHNGSIGVTSTPGMGSSFYFIIPKRSSHDVVEDELSTSNESSPERISITPSSITILMVEDNPTNMMFTGDYLTAKGFNLITAENGLQAIQQAEIHKPNLILMDIQMPELDGLEAIRRLRSKPEFASVPIIALTALAMPGDRERCLEAGASEYLAKPVSLKRLLGVITELLQ